MAFTLRQLQFFVAAAEQGSVSGAARALRRSIAIPNDLPHARHCAIGGATFAFLTFLKKDWRVPSQFCNGGITLSA